MSASFKVNTFSLTDLCTLTTQLYRLLLDSTLLIDSKTSKDTFDDTFDQKLNFEMYLTASNDCFK